MKQLVIDRALSAHIGLGDEICRAFAADLQVLDFAKVTSQAAARLAGSLFHYADQAGIHRHAKTPGA